MLLCKKIITYILFEIDFVTFVALSWDQHGICYIIIIIMSGQFVELFRPDTNAV